MTIDKSILYMSLYKQRLEESISDGLEEDIEAYDMAITVMRKYQKIKEIVKSSNGLFDGTLEHDKAFIKICKVVEDMEVTIDKCCTSKETYTVDNIISIMEKLLYDMRNSDGGEGALILDGQTFYTDAGYALEGMSIFIKVFKQRMGVEENVDTDAEQAENS